jgi:hypothetical protein
MTDKNIVFYMNAFADERVRRDLAVSAYDRVLLDFNKRADSRIVADFTSVKIHEREYLDVFA